MLQFFFGANCYKKVNPVGFCGTDGCFFFDFGNIFLMMIKDHFLMLWRQKFNRCYC